MYKFKTEPYEHQKDALKKCWNKESFAIFAEMGTGKTKIALDNACILYNKGRIDRLLVIAPKGTYMNWVDQEIPVHVPDYIEKDVLAWKPNITEKYEQQLKAIEEDIVPFGFIDDGSEQIKKIEIEDDPRQQWQIEYDREL